MTRNELITKWCAAEGGKVSALDAPQAREAYAKLRVIIGENFGVDLDDIIASRARYCYCSKNSVARISFRTYPWENGKPVKSSRKPAKPARKRG